MKTKRSIPDHWDPDAVITATSNPGVEYGIWAHSVAALPHTWQGDEFTKQDFIDYINHLKSYEPTETHHPCGAPIL
jgi:hypothetical protein